VAYRSAETTRPRVWVPGVVLVQTPEPWAPRGNASTVKLGALWDGREDVTNWKHIETFVAQSDLPEDERRYGALAEWPRLQQLCARAPIRIARGAEIALFRDRDVRVFTIGFARNADDFFSCFVERGGVLIRSVTGAFYEIRRSTNLEGDDDSELAERILVAATDGVVDGHALALARLVHVVVGGESSDERALRRLRSDLERELDEIDTRAVAFASDAAEIARRLREDGDDDTRDIPIYGVARRRRRPALTVRSIGEGDLASLVENDGHALALPAHDEWIVDDVTPWEPPTRAVRVAREREEVVARMWRHRIASAATAVVFATMFLLVIFILVRAGCR
jgi:hypothetical protein